MSGSRSRARRVGRDIVDVRTLVVVILLLVGVSAVSFAAADPVREQVISAPVEVPTLRSANSETFVNPDGSFTTRMYEHPINFRGERGEWQKIDASFGVSEKQGFLLASGENSFRVDVRNGVTDTGGLLRYSTGGVAVDLSLPAAEKTVVTRDGDNAVGFNDALPGVDLRYALLADGVKESIVLRSASAPSTYQFVVAPDGDAKGLSAEANDDGSIAFYRDGRGEPLFSVLAPTVTDSRTVDPKTVKVEDPRNAPPGSTPETGGKPPVGPTAPAGPAPASPGMVSQKVAELPDGSFAITVQVNEKWLASPDRVFPVVIDPTISQADVSDGYWNSASGTSTPNLTDGEVLVGYDGAGANYQSVLMFDQAVVPPGAQVTSAQVEAYATRCIPTWGGSNQAGCPWFWLGSGNYTDTLELYQVSSAWGASTQWSNVTVDSTSLGSFTGQFWGSGGAQMPSWLTFTNSTLVSRVQALVNGTTVNNGFVLKKTAGDPTGVAFAGSRYSDVSKAPRMVIQWVADGVYLSDSQHVHSNGAELTWTRFDGGLGPYGTAVMADAPVAYWRFDDQATSPIGVADWSGNGQHAFGSGGVAYQDQGATADGTTGIYFDGSTAGVERWGTGPVHNLADTFSAELWFKRQTTGGRQTLIARGESNGGGLRVQINPSNQIEFGYGSCFGCINSGILTTSTNTVTDTTGWHHLVATKAGSAVKLYIDGVDRTGTVSNATLTVGYGIIAFGRNYYHPDNSGTRLLTDYFQGWIDEPAFFSVPLTATQVSAHYNAGSVSTVSFNRYEVHRSSSSGFTPSGSTLIATIQDRAIQQYRDTTAKPNTTFYYKVLTSTSGGTYTSNQIQVTTPDKGYADLTIQPDVAGGVGRATTISSTAGCTNQGGAKSLTVNATNRALLHFDLRAIPSNATVNAATLSLFTFSTGTGTITANRVTSDWTEGTGTGTCDGSGATGTDRQQNLGWTTAGGDYSTTDAASHTLTGGNPAWDTWDVKNIVTGWLNGSYPNLGLLLKHSTEAGAPTISYPSDEYTTSYPRRPKLQVTYKDDSTPLPPRVAISSPAANGTVKGSSVTVEAAASDDGSVSQVQFKLDGNNLGAPDASPPYQVTWDTTTAARGQHTLTAVATDDAGNTSGAGTPPATDDFNRADAATLGAGWSSGGMDPGAACVLRVASNQAATATGSGSNWCDSYHLATSQTDGVAFVTVTAPQDTTNYEISVRGRMTDAGTATFDTYQATYKETGAADGYAIWKAVNGSWTQLASTTTGPNLAAGDQLGLKYVGTALSLWRKPAGGSWTQLLTATDSSITAAGKAGIQMRGPNGRVDDFTVASDFTVSTTTPTTVTVANSAAPTVAAPSAGSGGGAPAVTDTFNRADSASLGAAWSSGGMDPGAACVLRITANQAATATGSGSNWCDSYHLATSQTDGVAFVTVTAPQDTTNYEITVRGRMTDAGTSTFDTYQATYVEAGSTNDTYAIWKAVNGSWTQLAVTTTGPNMAAGDQLGLKYVGTAISLWRKPSGGSWTQLLSATDSSITAAGKAGIQMRGPNGRVDDFTVASDFTTGGSGAGALTVTTTASDDIGVSKVEFLVDGDLFATDLASPYSVTLDTLAFPVYDGSRTLTAKAYDADGNITTSTATSLSVTNASGTKYKATISTSNLPSQMHYDPAAGTQAAAPQTVGLTNTSAVNWPTASTKLRYRWIAADGTTTTSSDVSIGATDLGAGGNRNVSVSVDPPTLPAGVYRARYKLRIDLYDTTAAKYFAAMGNQPFEQTVTVTRLVVDELGLERYQQYDGEDLGGGVDNAVNLANGNNVVQWVPFNQPGLGLNTVVSLTYNSLEAGSASPIGNGWSLAISSLSPLGSKLDIHPNTADTAAGRTQKWIGLTDADGTFHKLVESATANVYTEPAGVNLYVRDTTAAGAQRYKLVKPDRTTFWYGDLGYPTSVVDQDGNTLSFTLTDVTAGDDAYGTGKQVTTVTDAGGRTFTLSYYTKADTGYPSVRGKVKTITDHTGTHRVRFDYYTDGSLLRATEEGGLNADGSFLADRSMVFTYTNVAGTAAAISTYAARVNPDPTTTQGSKLFSTIDFRGGETTFAYGTTGISTGRVTSRTNRTNNQTAYAYDTPVAGKTTVTMPLSRVWVYTFDSQGRVTAIDDPIASNGTTTVSWSTDNMPASVTEPTGAHTDFAYNANGYLTSKTVSNAANTQQLVTSLTYDNFTADASDPATHISRVKTLTQPAGTATGAKANDYKWTFAYVDNTEDHVQTVTGPDPDDTNPLPAAVTTNTWNANGTLASTTLPNNGDGLTRTTTYNTYDVAGLPTQVTDADGGVAKASYAANGNLQWLQDPNHSSFSGGNGSQYQQQFFYDSFGRLGSSSQPKSTAFLPGVLIWTDTVYDANDNITSQLSPHYGAGDSGVAPTVSSTYDAMDRPLVVTGPRAAADGGPVESETQYDAAGRVSRTIQPNGRKTPTSGSNYLLDYVTDTTYDLVDRVAQTASYTVDGTGAEISAQRRTTVYCYDLAGDLRSVTGPKANTPTAITCPTINLSAYTPTTAGYSGKFEYDFAHRQTKTIDPNGNYTTTTYNENGAPLTVVDWVSAAGQEAARTTTFTYNDRGEKTQQVSPFDGTTRRLTSKWTYDPLGNIATEISPRAYDTNSGNLYVKTNAYDKLNRLLKVTLPDDASTTQAYLHYGYDKNGNQTSISLPTDKTDPTALATSEKTTVSYWDTGAVYSSTDPANPTVRFDYTAEGWQALRVPEQVGQAGRLDLARTMYWDYLPDGLLKATRDIGGQRASYAYDANGNRTTVNEANGITQSSQTALNLTSTFTGFNELKTVAGPKFGVANCTQTSSFTYDLHGNLASLGENAEAGAGCTTLAARTFAYAYDSADRLTSQTDDYRTSGTSTDDEQYTFAYTPAGWLSTRTVSKAGSPWTQEQQSVRTYYDNGQLKDLKNYGTTTVTSPDNALESHTLSYITGGGIYMNGNRVSDSFKLKPADGSTTCFNTACTASWTYDARDRLTQETPGTPSSNPTAFTLDVIGNATSETTGANTTTRTFNGQQLATITVGGTTNRYLYDAYGNVDCVTDGSWAATSCPTASNNALLSDNVYDYSNRLTATRSYNGAGTLTDSADYVNDPLDRPVKEIEYHATAQTTDVTKGWEAGTTTTGFTYLGISNAVVQESAVNGATTKNRSYAYDGLGQRATLTENSNRYSYLYDPHGSVSLLLDQTNGIKASYGYSAYGSPNTGITKIATGFVPTSNPYRYTGKRFDTGSGTYDMGARRYSAGAGRFLQYDQYSGALENLGFSIDPINANRYAFTGANPVNYIEIDGHKPMPDSFEVVGFDHGTGGFGMGAHDLPGATSAAATVVVSRLATRPGGQPRTSLSGSEAEPRRPANPRELRGESDTGGATKVSPTRSVDRQVLQMLRQAGIKEDAYSVESWSSVGRPMPTPRDVFHASNGNTPVRLDYPGRRIGKNPVQNRQVGQMARMADDAGALDIRVDQQQVNAGRSRVGWNRPDLQFTLNDRRYYIELDTVTSNRGAAHARRLLANDPDATVILVRSP